MPINSVTGCSSSVIDTCTVDTPSPHRHCLRLYLLSHWLVHLISTKLLLLLLLLLKRLILTLNISTPDNRHCSPCTTNEARHRTHTAHSGEVWAVTSQAIIDYVGTQVLLVKMILKLLLLLSFCLSANSANLALMLSYAIRIDTTSSDTT